MPPLAILLAGGARHALDAIDQSLSPDDYRFLLGPDLRVLVRSTRCGKRFGYTACNEKQLTLMYQNMASAVRKQPRQAAAVMTSR
jgi:hypothetical protein